jgi:CDP-4-dehydro-6-deoxyglucose reductase
MYLISFHADGHFEAAGTETLLEAANRSQHHWSYSCRTGRCNSCKCRVLSGQTQALWPETGLSDEEKAAGWILACVRSASSDLRLEVDDLTRYPLAPVQTLPCKISDLKRLAPNVMRVNLRLPPNSRFEYLSGQFIELTGPAGIRRSYSLAKTHAADKILELHVRAVEGGAFSRYWFTQARSNDLLRLRGPLGTFFLRETTALDLIFLATGTGLAPIKAMLESLSELPAAQQPRSVSVWWGARTLQDLYWDWRDLPREYRFVPVLSKPHPEWSGQVGHVQDVLLAGQPVLKNAVVYACGSPAMVSSACSALLKAGLDPQSYHADAFVSSGAS